MLRSCRSRFGPLQLNRVRPRQSESPRTESRSADGVRAGGLTRALWEKEKIQRRTEKLHFQSHWILVGRKKPNDWFWLAGRVVTRNPIRALSRNWPLHSVGNSNDDQYYIAAVNLRFGRGI